MLNKLSFSDKFFLTTLAGVINFENFTVLFHSQKLNADV